MAKILIVEDNPTNLSLGIFLLESVGHTVLTATDAEAGLTLARDKQPQLILMDTNSHTSLSLRHKANIDQNELSDYFSLTNELGNYQAR